MYTGPNIVRDGLILQFDPANIKCFRGEPTVNIVTNQNFSTNWAGSTPPISILSGVTTFREASGDTYWYNVHNFGSSIANKTFTASCKMKTIDCEKSKGISIYWIDANGSWIFQNNYWSNISNLNSLEYEYLTVTAVAPTNAIKACFFIGFGYDNNTLMDTNGLTYVKECMLEEKRPLNAIYPNIKRNNSSNRWWFNRFIK